MRLEINSMWLGTGATVSGFQSDFGKMMKDQQKVVESFTDVKNATYRANGGVGKLQTALDHIDARIKTEETKVENLAKVQQDTDDFIELADKVDKKVAELVKKNQNEFYRVNPWARPPKAEEDSRNWFQRAWDWMGDQFNQAVDTIKHGLESIGKWIKDNAASLIKIAIGAVVVVGLALVVAFASPAVAFVAAVALIGVAIGVGTKLVGGYTKAAIDAANGEDVDWLKVGADAFFEGTINGTTSGIADGLGYLYGPGVRAAVGIPLQGLGGAIINGTNYLLGDDKNHDSFLSATLEGLGGGLINGGIDSLFFYTGYKSKYEFKDLSSLKDLAFKDTFKAVLEHYEMNVLGKTIWTHAVLTWGSEFINTPLNLGLNYVLKEHLGIELPKGVKIINIQLGDFIKADAPQAKDIYNNLLKFKSWSGEGGIAESLLKNANKQWCKNLLGQATLKSIGEKIGTAIGSNLDGFKNLRDVIAMPIMPPIMPITPILQNMSLGGMASGSAAF